jgi:fibronectin type 3 domain-containing protein
MKLGIVIGIVFLFILPIQTYGEAIDDSGQPDQFENVTLNPVEETIMGGMGVFIENRGQWDPDILFVTSTSFGNTALCKDGIRHQVFLKGQEKPFDPLKKRETKISDSSIVTISFKEGSPYSIVGEDQVDTVYNFFLGNDPTHWASNVIGYESVLYNDVWPGIDIRYYQKNGLLKYDIIVSSGSNPDMIKMTVDGVSSVSLVQRSLIMRTPLGISLIDTAPTATYIDGSNIEVDFILDDSSYSFDLGPYDRSQIVVIDPNYNTDVIEFSTYFGGSGDEFPYQMSIDSVGCIYVIGDTRSSDFPTSQGCIQSGFGGAQDVFVFKIDKTGTNRIYATYLGGKLADWGSDIEVNSKGQAYISGYTASDNFPLTDDAYCNNLKSCDLFISCLDGTGSTLLYSTFLGGSDDDIHPHIDLDLNGDLYLVAGTFSKDFPITMNAYQNTLVNSGQETDMIILKFNLASMSLLYSTFLGGSLSEYPQSLVYKSNNIYIVGSTKSLDFNVTENAYQPNNAGKSDGYIIIFNLTTNCLTYSTYFGGNFVDGFSDLKLDLKGNIFTCGQTMSVNFPCTEGVIDKKEGGMYDGIVVGMSNMGKSLLFSTYLGGDGAEKLFGLDLDFQGNIHVTGSEEEEPPYGYRFNVTEGCLQETPGGGDAEVIYAKINNNGSVIVYSTFIGGSDIDDGQSIIYDNENDDAIILGSTLSADFPIRTGSFQNNNNGGSDIFIIKFNLSIHPSSPLNLKGNPGNSFVNLTWNIPENNGGSAIINYTVWGGISEDKLEKKYVVTESTFNDTEVENGITYFYAITARNRAGSGPFSNVVSFRPAGVPSPPKDFKILSIGDKSINLTWNTPENLGGIGISILAYNLYKLKKGETNPMIIPIQSTSSKYTDLFVDNGVNYSYSITSVNEIGESLHSASICAIPMTVPTIVRDITYKAGDGFIHLYWTEPENNGGSPIINYSITRQGVSSKTVLLGPNVRDLNDTNLVNGNLYRYTIRAKNIAGFSPPAEEISDTPLSAPSPPTAFTLEAHPGSILLTWGLPDSDGGSPIENYLIYRKNDDGSWERVKTVLPSEFSSTESSLVNGHIYFYRISALNHANRESVPTAELNATPMDNPGVVLNLKVDAGDGFVQIFWNEPSSDGGSQILKYEIMRKESSSIFTNLNFVDFPVTSYNDTAVTNGIKYQYQVRAFSAFGNGTPVEIGDIMPSGIPSPPSSIKASAWNESVEITWTKPEKDGGLPILTIRIYRGTSLSSMVNIFEAGLSQWSYKDTNLTNGVKYFYTLAAVNLKGEGRQSEPVNATPVGLPSAPLSVILKVLSSSIQISWTVPELTGGSPILKYFIYRSIGGGAWIKISEVAGDQTKYLDENLEKGIEYRYRVTAINGQGEGPQSVEQVMNINKESNKIFAPIIFVSLPIILILTVGIILFLVLRKRNKTSIVNEEKTNEMAIPLESSSPDQTSVEPAPEESIPFPENIDQIQQHIIMNEVPIEQKMNETISEDTVTNSDQL